MNELNQAVTALNAAIASLEARLGNGVIVNSADLAAAAASINSAAQTLDTLAV